MNSITRHLTPRAIVATLQMMRSARKEVFLVVEGDDDIALFSEALRLPQSCFISCFGKERLMDVFCLAPSPQLDSGMIFIRDSDFDDIEHHERGGIQILVSDHYDFEMSLLQGRLFSRIMKEFLGKKSEPSFIKQAFDLLLGAAAAIGAARSVAKEQSLALKFDGMNTGFLSKKDMSVNIMEMVRYLVSRSKIKVEDLNSLHESILRVMDETPFENLVCGKDLLQVMSVALSRHYRCCNAHECSEITLARMLRVASVQDDIRSMSLYPVLAQRVATSAIAGPERS